MSSAGVSGSVIPMPLRLIASDLDGTLLRNDLSVSPRTRRALDAARAAGIHVVPVTARQPIGVRRIAEDAGFGGWALCSNGALGIHLQTGEVLFERHLAPEVQRSLAEAMREAVPGTVFASIREAGEGFYAQGDYADLAAETDHKRDPATMGRYALEEVVSGPSLKFVLRHPHVSPPELLAAVRGLGLGGFHATHSGAAFVEVAAEGLTKAAGLALLCGKLGVAQADTLAFGDAPNDAEMLAWAGRGVAMGGAHPEARAAADEVTLSNEEDGVAVVVERVLAELA